MLRLRRVYEATMYEKGWNDLCKFIKGIVSSHGLRMADIDGTGFMLRKGRNKSDNDLHVSLSITEGTDGVYTLSIDGVDRLSWRISDNPIRDKKTGKMKVFDKEKQVNNMLDVAKATIDRLEKEDNENSGGKTEGIRRYSRIRFI